MSDGNVYSSVTRVIRDKIISVEWKIPEFMALPHKGFKRIESSTFMLSDSEWFIRIYPELRKDKAYVYIVKKISSGELRASYSVAVLKADGSLFKSLFSMRVFGAEKCSSGDFSVSRSELNSMDVLSDGSITVLVSVCILDKTAEPVTMDAVCQTESSDVLGLETLSQNFKDLFLDGAQSDITFKVQGKDFMAHKAVVSARSTVFHTMLKTDMVEKNEGIIHVLDSQPNHFNDFLLYVYSGKLNVVTPSNALGLYRLADKYNFEDLKRSCCKCLICEISVDSFFDIAILASLHNETKLMEVVKGFFNTNASIIFRTSIWTSFMAEHSALAKELLIQMADKNKEKC